MITAFTAGTPAPVVKPKALAGLFRFNSRTRMGTTTGTVCNKKTRKVTKRTYRCTIRLVKGTWTVTTTARGTAGVVAEGSRRVVVK